MLGLLAIAVKSDLEISPGISKFLSLYLLFDIGLKGGQELFHSGFHASVIKVIIACLVFSFFMPFISFKILRLKLDLFNAGAIAATYGSVSAVTFITASSFLDTHNIPFSGFMVAGMALMESPAIISGFILIKSALRKEHHESENQKNMGQVLHEALTNGSVFLLIGSLVIGYICGSPGEAALKPFISDIFKGMLCLYMLEMGIVAASKISSLKKSGLFLASFALLYPLCIGSLGILTAKLMGLEEGNALLFTILTASASYIAVPAAMRYAIPQVNLSLLLPMSLGVTFTFNVIFGIPLYYLIIERVWQMAG